MVLQFTPGFDGNASVSRWLVQGQSSRNSQWEQLYAISAPEATTIAVQNLIPYTTYRLVLASNTGP